MSKQFIHGLVLVDVDGAALNNQGLTGKSANENIVEVKKITKNRNTYVYVSGQAWRYWWLQTLVLDRGWKLSIASRDEKIARVNIDPFVYPNDDLFGYMYATKKNKDTGDGGTVSRVSPLKNSVLVSVSPVRVVRDFGVMSRQEGNPVPYEKEVYSATLKGLFSIDLDEAGTFSDQNRSGFMNLTEKQYEAHKHDDGVREVDDLVMRDPKTEQPLRRLRLAADERKRRVNDVLQALKTLSGGAKAATNLASVTPSFVILGLQRGGNHVFSHVPVDREGTPAISMDALQQTLKDYGDRFLFPPVIGRNAGFMDELDAELSEMAAGKSISYGSVTSAIDLFCTLAEPFID